MDKQEILEKAQNEKKSADEMETKVTEQGNTFTIFAVLLFVLILMTVKIIADDKPWYDVYSIMFVTLGVSHLYKGIKLHQTHEIVLGVLFSAASLLALGTSIYEILK